MKFAFIVPYFGKFHNYFSVTLKTISKNPSIKWIFFTDDKTQYAWPENAEVHYMTFSEMKKIIQSKFDFPISLEKPYKLCDYRPAYGYIFSEYLQGYDFWGHCDIDVIFGNLSHFLTDDLMQYDKLFSFGHMTLYKNTDENNKRFMLPDKNDNPFYKQVFSSSEKFLFDEVSNGRYNICTLWEDYHFSVFNQFNWVADIAQKSSYFQLTEIKHFEPANIQNQVLFSKHPRKHQIFWWDNGTLFLSYFEESYVQKEMMYMHLIRRTKKMEINIEPNCNLFKVIPHEFSLLRAEISSKNFYNEKWWNPNLFYFELRLENLKSKLRG